MNTTIYTSNCNSTYMTNGTARTFMKPVVNLSATGMNIKSLMKSSGVSARQLQFLMDFPYIQTIYNWTRGINLPTIDNLVVLSKIFNVSINDIVITDMVEISLNPAAEIMSA
ncbi:helix-turn-helix domain-containing protein [Treponema sp.]|uniref:helix-turn-helix domain-containing protein n=1 Tax=Treponema sp. TaxID=166 RepID=UPI00388E118B